jgi:hypothetical protein
MTTMTTMIGVLIVTMMMTTMMMKMLVPIPNSRAALDG